MKKNIIKYFTLLAVNTLVASNLFAQVPLVFDVENRTAPGCNTAAGNTNTTNTSLPDPFKFTTGGRVATFDDWTCRRNQIKSNIENFEIGPKPPKPSSVTATYSGGKLTVTVKENGQTLTLSSNVTMPSGTGPFPVVIGMNSGTGGLSSNLFSGVIQIPFNHDQVVSYGGGSGSMNAGDPYFKLYPGTNIGKYSAWSWGISRLIDGIEIVKSQMNADPKRICVTGCSYAGKMALFGGAFDERIALTIAQESGGGGINSWRMSKAYTDRTGVSVEKIDNTNYSWFKSSMKNLNPNNLPYDHHELIAMIAPRALLILGNPTMEWLCDESGYKATMAAAEVWKAMGVSERLGFVFTPDHNHCAADQAQNNASTAFINKFLKNTTANTDIRVNPTKGTKQDLSMTNVINWTTPTITFSTPDPNTPAVSLTAPANNSSYETPVSIIFTANVTNAKNTISKVEFYNGTTKIGEALTQPYSYTWANVVPGAYSITAKVTDSKTLSSNSTPVNITVNAPFPVIYKISSPPIIDGIIDEIWNNESIAAIEAQKVILPTVTNTKDLSGYAKLLWDNMYVYLLAVITDDAKVNDSQNSYEDDSVEFYFDANNDKSTTYDVNDVQYTFGWNDGTIVGFLPTGRSVIGITYSSVNTTDGYIVEARIPWTTLQGTPTAGKLIGFDFMINDDDDGGGRDGKLAWNAPSDNAWENPSLFGTLKLMDNEIITSFDRIKNLDVNVYPNPAQGLLYIRGLDGLSEYIITDLAGRTMQGGQSSESINISTLESGMYNLILKNNATSQVIKFVVSQ